MSTRRTIVAHGRLAMRELRLDAARDRLHGRQVMTFEQLAIRMAGGFTQPVDNEALRAAIQEVLPLTDLGELDAIKLLPGMVDAAAETLHKAWRAGIDFAARASEHPRLMSVARLEAAVLAKLPPQMMRPVDIVAAAMPRLEHAMSVLGPVDIVGITELSPCWRPLLHALAGHTSVSWVAGPRSVPSWLDGSLVEIQRSTPLMPSVTTISASTNYHEAIEAVRWARELIVSGVAAPSQIAIAATAPSDYDAHFLSLRADANLDIHFAHGIAVTATRDGQTAAALADVVLRGLSQTRVRRLSALLRSEPGPFGALPPGWTRILPAEAPLATVDAWSRALAHVAATDWPDGIDHAAALMGIIRLLDQGAAEVGEAMLNGRALAIWRKALIAGSPSSLDTTLESMKQDDGLEACVSVAWMPASALAASPRPFVRLLGLNSSRWPRGVSEDRLLADHIIPSTQIDPLPVGMADRRDFETILATTEREVVLSRARRDSEGRLLGRSALLQGQPAEIYVRRGAVPAHAMSETDRLLARPEEFQTVPQALSAASCSRDWRRPQVTGHDGLVRADHPLILRILERTQSASSLTKLLRNPIGYVWQYGLGWRAPDSGADPIVLNALEMGDLIHMVLDTALTLLEAEGGLSAATADEVSEAVARAVTETGGVWEDERAVPPAVIWRRTLQDAARLSVLALTFGDDWLTDSRSFGEVPFGGTPPRSDTPTPWDITLPVVIPGAGFRIAGYIDRLDVSRNGRRALVRDYKTGRPPKSAIVLDGGKELQRCLYAFAVKALLGEDVEIAASLLFLRQPIDLRLDDPGATLTELTGYLSAARTSFASGASLIGPGSGGDYDDLAFALPANASATYCKRKMADVTERIGPAAQIWEAP